MEGDWSTGNLKPRAPYGGVLDLQGSMHMHHQEHPHASLQHHQYPQQRRQEQQHQQQRQQQNQQQKQQSQHGCQRAMMVHPPMHEAFPASVGHVHHFNQQQAPQMIGYSKHERIKNSTSDEDEPHDGCLDDHDDLNNERKETAWQRMKWTDTMIKLLITVVSYIGEDAPSDCSSGMKRKFSVLQKKGKWKSVSKVMAERGCYVSPQQCEDKFNDLNKRYKRLTEILGRGTSCEVVENPTLLDLMDHLSEKMKDNVRKILSSKHLFYEEMCSYHNGNRLHLPADPSIQQSLQLALRSCDDHDTRRASQDDLGEDDHGAEMDDRDDEEEDIDTLHGDTCTAGSCFPQSVMLAFDEGTGRANPSCYQDCNRRSHPQSISLNMNQVFPEGSKASQLQKQLLESRAHQLQEQQLHIQVEMLELEMQRLKWQQFSRKKNRELDKLRLENEKMKLENEHLAFELKHKKLEKNLRTI